MASSSTQNISKSNKKMNNKLPLSQLAKLPPTQHTIMKKIVTLNPQEIAYTDICTQLKAEGVAQGEIDTSLHQLVQEGYISSFFDNGVFKYMATVDGDGRPSSVDHEQRWDNFTFGLDQLDINLDD